MEGVLMADETVNIYEYGIKNLVVAFKSAEATATNGYEVPIPVPGATKLKIAFKSNDATLYAEDKVWAIIKNTSSVNLTASIYQTLSKDLRKRMMGHLTDANGIGYVVNHPKPEQFAIGCEFEGEKQNYRRWFYECVASDPDEERKTTEDKLTANEQDIAIVATPCSIGDENIICSDPIGSVDDKAVYDTYLKSVYVASAATKALTGTSA